MAKRGTVIVLFVMLLAVTQSTDAFAQSFMSRQFSDDPAPKDYRLGNHQLRVPSNCVVQQESSDDRIRDSGDSTRTFNFIWPELDCFSWDDREAFANPATEELVAILARQGSDGPQPRGSIPYRRFAGLIEGQTIYEFDEATLNLSYDSELDMYVKHTTFYGEQAIALYVDRDHDLSQIERLLRCGEGDYYCVWYADVCGILLRITFNRVQLAEAKAIYADTKRLFCHDWREAP